MSDRDKCAGTGHSESITIVICSHSGDRWITLQRAVDAVKKQMQFNDELLVIVDNNRELFARCNESFTHCTVVENRRRRGLSGARNTALDAAHGAVIVFLDDDAVPGDDWLDELRAPYSDNNIYGVGGLILPCWPASPPRWFPDEFLWVVGCTHRGIPHAPHQVRNLIGANMSFRASVFKETGGFVETMGRIGRRPLGCEETELCIRLAKADPNAILLFQPTARVDHHISTERCSFRYFVRRCWAEGISKAEVSRRVGSSSALSEERQYALRVLPAGIWQGLCESAAGDYKGAVRSAVATLGLFLTAAGYFIGKLHYRSASSHEAS